MEVQQVTRRRLLAKAASPIRYSDHLEGDALGMKLQACELGLEGIVSKLKDSRYVAGHSDLWAKTPCRMRETYAIVGYALKGRKFDGFYLGEERKGKLEYAGKIESGWTERRRRLCSPRRKRSRPATRPFQRKSIRQRRSGSSPEFSSMSNTALRRRRAVSCVTPLSKACAATSWTE
jgi:bifunctional non-homologous end joining protein LigD